MTKTYSIYHFFADLCLKKIHFLSDTKLEQFPFDEEMLSCRNDGVFPDLAIRLNNSDPLFTGGELVELKHSNKYSISSFNSTIPTGTKEISKLLTVETASMFTQMQTAGDDVNSLSSREVYYLIRGKRQSRRDGLTTKVCLVHGSFFETIPTNNLILNSFLQVLHEQIEKHQFSISGAEIENLLSTVSDLELLSDQSSFSKVRHVDQSSVSLRFRIMTEVEADANLLASVKYPEIRHDTLNLVVPCKTESERALQLTKFQRALSDYLIFDSLPYSPLTIKHHRNGEYLVFQVPLASV